MFFQKNVKRWVIMMIFWSVWFSGWTDCVAGFGLCNYGRKLWHLASPKYNINTHLDLLYLFRIWLQMSLCYRCCYLVGVMLMLMMMIMLMMVSLIYNSNSTRLVIRNVKWNAYIIDNDNCFGFHVTYLYSQLSLSPTSRLVISVQSIFFLSP